MTLFPSSQDRVMKPQLTNQLVGVCCLSVIRAVWVLAVVGGLALTAVAEYPQDAGQLGSTRQSLGIERPNFIVIFCDNLGYGDIEPFGSSWHGTECKPRPSHKSA